MTARGYFVDTNFIKKGEYKPTALDERKRQADFLITAVYGERYEIRCNRIKRPIELKQSRSVKPMNNGIYLVTEKALETLKKQYSFECDF
ncbi:MAG: hypothetical protein IJ640_10535 [Prevotella sp.]|nr:hypothetical protein [Prevotella sp.]